jgi:hypothetical protein
MSYFIAADGNDAAFVFANGVWTLNETYNNTCSSGDKSEFVYTETMTLPQPARDPITSLTAHGYENAPPEAGASCTSQAYDETYTRTGD